MPIGGAETQRRVSVAFLEANNSVLWWQPQGIAIYHFDWLVILPQYATCYFAAPQGYCSKRHFSHQASYLLVISTPYQSISWFDSINFFSKSFTYVAGPSLIATVRATMTYCEREGVRGSNECNRIHGCNVGYRLLLFMAFVLIRDGSKAV